MPVVWAAANESPDETSLMIMEFAHQMHLKHDFNEEEVLSILRSARPRQSVLRAMTRPPERLSGWLAYKERFINPTHIKNGKAFASDNSEILDRVYQIYGVPAEVVVAIVGVETNYGSYYGRYRTLDALVSLAFANFRRAEFFKGELEEFLLLANEQDKSPLSYTSSYAGAMGYGQFLPSSYRKYAVDFDDDGIIDLSSSVADALGSIGNYLSSFGWVQNMPVVLAASRNIDEQSNQNIRNIREPEFQISFEPYISLRNARRRHAIEPADSNLTSGQSTDYKFSIRDRFVLLRYEDEEPEIWLGTSNYYVLSRYNPSSKYVMSLYLLSQAIASE